tara:strand:+ start:921 stop:2006 length:1086 start_codon:yes stop_codon:yes gene_type:complete
MKKKNIAFVFPYNSWGGAFRSTYILTNALVERGWLVDILFPIIPPRNGYKILSYDWFRDKFLGLLRSIIKRNKVYFPVKSKIKCIPWISSIWVKNYDFIVANHWNTVEDVYRLAERCGVKYHYIRDIEQWAFYYPYEVDGFKLGIKKIALTSWIQNYLKEHLNIKVDAVIPNGTDITPFTLKSKKPSVDKLTVGMCYSPQYIKGCTYGLQGINKAIKKRSNLKVILFGYEKPKEFLDFPYEWIQAPKGELLREVYRRIHIFVSTSIQEGYQNPPREAMAAKCSVISTDVGCIPDLGIHEENLLKVNTKNSESVAKNIIRLTDDEQLRDKIAQAGFKTVSKDSWIPKVDAFESLLIKFINKN